MTEKSVCGSAIVAAASQRASECRDASKRACFHITRPLLLLKISNSNSSCTQRLKINSKLSNLFTSNCTGNLCHRSNRMHNITAKFPRTPKQAVSYLPLGRRRRMLLVRAGSLSSVRRQSSAQGGDVHALVQLHFRGNSCDNRILTDVCTIFIISHVFLSSAYEQMGYQMDGSNTGPALPKHQHEMQSHFPFIGS